MSYVEVVLAITLTILACSFSIICAVEQKDCLDITKHCWHYDKPECRNFTSYDGKKKMTRTGKECNSNCKIGDSPGLEYPLCLPKKKKYADIEEFCYRSCSEEICFNAADNCWHYERPDCRGSGIHDGTKTTTTMSGTQCAKWSESTVYDIFSKKNDNVCQAPNQFSLIHSVPMCVPTNRKSGLEYCFPPCTSNCYNEDIGCFASWNGKCKFSVSYNGNKNMTKYGVPCMKWNDTNLGVLYPDHNYCRNPDSSPEGAWCYTSIEPGTERTKRDYCFKSSLSCTIPKASHGDNPGVNSAGSTNAALGLSVFAFIGMVFTLFVVVMVGLWVKRQNKKWKKSQKKAKKAASETSRSAKSLTVKSEKPSTKSKINANLTFVEIQQWT